MKKKLKNFEKKTLKFLKKQTVVFGRINSVVVFDIVLVGINIFVDFVV